MPIRILLKDDLAFTPEDSKVLTTVFEDTLKALSLVDRDDPLTHLVARKVIEVAKLGQRDPERLRSCVLASLSGGTDTAP
jgi:hypothetical protein